MLRTILLGATGGRLYYEELWDVGYDHISDVVNHLPEAGEETPMMKAGGTEVTIEDMVEAFGAYTVYYESKERRPSKGRQTDAPGTGASWVMRPRHVRTFSGKLLPKNIGMSILFGKESSRRVDPAAGPWKKVTPSLNPIFRTGAL